jgi:predicted acylesterase/phospholipase RssA
MPEPHETNANDPVVDPESHQYPTSATVISSLADSGFRFWLAGLQLCGFLYSLYVERRGDSTQLARFLERNLLVEILAARIASSIPLVPIGFWYFLSLFGAWYFVGALLDHIHPPLLRRGLPFVRVAMSLAFASVAYALYLASGYGPRLSTAEWIGSLTLPLLLWSAAAFGAGILIGHLRRSVRMAKGSSWPYFAIPLFGVAYFGFIHPPFDPRELIEGHVAVVPFGFWSLYPVAQVGTVFWLLGLLQLGARRNATASVIPQKQLSIDLPSYRSLALDWQARFRDLSMRSIALLAVGIWVAGCFLVQSRAAFSKLMVAVVILVFLLRWLLPQLRAYSWFLFGWIVLAAALWRAGSYHFELDIISGIVASGLALRYAFGNQQRHARTLQFRTAVLMILSAWLLWSLDDLLFPVMHAPLDPSRFATIRSQSDYPQKRIGVALSGGGYRATLFHAGILAGLEKLRIPATNISAVSGGSITSAYYAAGGAPTDLLTVFVQHKFRLWRDLIDCQNALRLLFPAQVPGTDVRLLPFYYFSRTDLHREVLDRVLLQGTQFKNLKSDAPELLIGTTDLTSGRATGLSKDFVLTRFLLRPPGEEIFPNVKRLYAVTPRLSAGSTLTDNADFGSHKLSQAVAASGALPLAFEPVRLLLNPAGAFVLIDGGVTDNSGMTLLLDADWYASFKNAEQSESNWALDIAIAADGGAIFAPEAAPSDEGASRAFDIIYARIGLQVPTEQRGPVHPKAPPVVLLSPSMYVDNSVGYDYQKYGFHRENGRFANFDGPQRHPLDMQQQKLVRLVATQVGDLDAESLALIRDINPERYGSPVDRLLAPDSEKKPLDATTALARDVTRESGVLILAEEIAADLSQDLQEFFSTSTLKDDFQPEEAERLFQLGEYLVMLNAHQMREYLGDGSRTTIPTILDDAQKRQLLCYVNFDLGDTPESSIFVSSTRGRDPQYYQLLQKCLGPR